MKICFICSTVEPGRHGIGDYTRRLAGEIIRQGHVAQIIALNDVFINDKIDGVQEIDGAGVSVLRLPSTWAIRLRRRAAKEWIDRFDPEFLSFQFCLFSFHPKGLPFYLCSLLSELGQGRRWHIMFHETWVGKRNRFDWKSVLRAFLQKKLLECIVKALKPAIVHTHLPIYCLEIKKLGVDVKELPLFSNVPVVSEKHSLLEMGVFRVGLFGQIDFSHQITSFLVKLAQNVAFSGAKLELLVIGEIDERIQGLLATIEQISIFRGRTKCTGFLNERALSLALQRCTIGLTPVPRHALGKSGTVASFIAHSIPVAAPNVYPKCGPDAIGFFSSKLRSAVILEPDHVVVEDAKQAAFKASSEINISLITQSFLAEFQ